MYIRHSLLKLKQGCQLIYGGKLRKSMLHLLLSPLSSLSSFYAKQIGTGLAYV